MEAMLVAGARPNFMKIAPLLNAMRRFNQERGEFFKPVLLHTGQHYDYEMSRVFFEDLGLPDPDIYLGVGSGTHAEQTGKVMVELEKILLRRKPDLVIVVGDVNSTLAAALVAVKLFIPIAHVEAGLRSYDKSIPEEVNRVLTDHISDYLFTPGADASENLRKEGIPDEKVFLVGNVMVDSLLSSLEKIKNNPPLPNLELKEKEYAVLTLHRPANVDQKDRLAALLKAVGEVSSRIPVVFPVHPRTRKNLVGFQLEPLLQQSADLHLIEPLGYLDFLRLVRNARFVMTDSGGVQEETTILNIPCLTLRDTTEWNITVTQGTNTLVGNGERRLVEEAFNIILNGAAKKSARIELWDGRAAERIVEILSRKEREWKSGSGKN